MKFMMTMAMGLVVLSVVEAAELAPGKAELSPVVPFVIPAGKPSEADCRELVKTLAGAGCDQFLIYPSTGLEYEYLGDEFFGMVGHFLDEARRRGMGVWLYDEFNWPSGTARGRVPAENEAWIYRELVAVTNAAGQVEWQVVVSREPNFDNYCLDGNNFEAEGVRRFMELTHQAYGKRFGPYFGSTIRGIFTDEPGHCSSAWRLKMPAGTVLRLPYWSTMEAEYRLASGGRDFRADYEKARAEGTLATSDIFRIWTEIRSRRYRQTYFDPIREWCERQGIVSCGHIISEETPRNCARLNGLPLNTLRGLGKPGIDLIKSNTDRNFEWLTLAFAQSAARARNTQGVVELFALGPSDLTFTVMRKLYWICALHRIDTYFQSLYHCRAFRFIKKDSWAMFSSPTQPWFGEMPLLHETAKEAARWARKPFRCDVAVVYPQRLAGVASFVGGEGADTPFVALCRELTWNQLTFDLIEEDEQTTCETVIDWKGVKPFDRRSGRVFATVAEAVAWLDTRYASRSRVTTDEGKTAEGFVTRSYLDGSAVAVDARSGEVIVAPDGQLRRRVVSAAAGRPLADSWKLTLSELSKRRVWIRDGKAKVTVDNSLKGIRFAVRRFPADLRFAVKLDGKPLAFVRPCASVAYAFNELYEETEPLDLAIGEHVFEFSGGSDGKMFLPALWMVGDFSEPSAGRLSSAPTAVACGSLAERGYPSFAGKATYSAEVLFATGERLIVDSGEAVVRVRLGGRDLGAKGWAPFAWDIPAELAGKRLPLEIDVITSVRPIFGNDKSSEAKLDHSLWVPSSLYEQSPVGLRGAWAKRQ